MNVDLLWLIGIGVAVAEVLGLDSGKPSDKARIKAMIKTWLESGALVESVARCNSKDVPIVMVAGVRTGADTVRLAATGVATTPVLIDLDALDALDPPDDFRGSAAYRRHLAATLGARVVTQLAEGGQG